MKFGLDKIFQKNIVKLPDNGATGGGPTDTEKVDLASENLISAVSRVAGLVAQGVSVKYNPTEDIIDTLGEKTLNKSVYNEQILKKVFVHLQGLPENQIIIKTFLNFVQVQYGSNISGPMQEIAYRPNVEKFKTPAPKIETPKTETKKVIALTPSEKIHETLIEAKNRVNRAQSENLSGGQELVDKLKKINTALATYYKQQLADLDTQIKENTISEKDANLVRQSLSDLAAYGKTLHEIITSEINHLVSLEEFTKYMPKD